MSDEQQIRNLLTLAAELPDDVQPPIGRLLARGHRRRFRRFIVAALATAAVTVAAVVVPPLVRIPASGSFTPSHVTIPSHFTEPPPQQAGPTARQISQFVWASLQISPLGARSQPILAWTGNELLEIGGFSGNRLYSDGAAYSLDTGSWHQIATAPGVVGATTGSSVWTGHELFVVGGRISPSTESLVGPWAGLYNPSDNRWTATLLPSQLAGLNAMSVAWTGSEVVVTGTNINSQQLGVAAYNPVTGHWQVITPGLPSGHPPRYAAVVVTSDRVILWSLWDVATTYSGGASDYAGVDVLVLGADGIWREVTGNWPQEQFVMSPIFTGSQILVSPSGIWCGEICSPPGGAGAPGYFADPATLHRTVIPDGPIGPTTPDFIWTGREIIAVNLNVRGELSAHGPAVRPDDMALWDPASARWSRLPAPPGNPSLAATPIWAGSRIWAESRLLALASNGELLSFMHNCC